MNSDTNSWRLTMTDSARDDRTIVDFLKVGWFPLFWLAMTLYHLVWLDVQVSHFDRYVNMLVGGLGTAIFYNVREIERLKD